MKVNIANTTKEIIPRLDFDGIKKATLGAAYDLTLVVTTPAEMRKLNLTYRDINKPTDILSFPLSKTEGEMCLCPLQAKKEAKKFTRGYENFFAFLFIHGCAHLKGYEHGDTMERYEQALRKRFGV